MESGWRRADSCGPIGARTSARFRTGRGIPRSMISRFACGGSTRPRTGCCKRPRAFVQCRTTAPPMAEEGRTAHLLRLRENERTQHGHHHRRGQTQTLGPRGAAGGVRGARRDGVLAGPARLHSRPYFQRGRRSEHRPFALRRFRRRGRVRVRRAGDPVHRPAARRLAGRRQDARRLHPFDDDRRSHHRAGLFDRTARRRSGRWSPASSACCSAGRCRRR